MRAALFATFAALVACLIAVWLAPSAPAQCRIEQRASVALWITDFGWTVPLMVNGVRLPFVLDTGAEYSMIFEDAADGIGIRRDAAAATTLEGVGGEVRRPNALANSLTLEGLALRRTTRATDVSLAVGPPVGGSAGVLGQDLLSPYDLDIDTNQDRLRLLSVSGCDGRFRPFGADADDEAIPGRRVARNIVLFPIRIDGHALMAMLDTGALTSLVTATGMAKLGLTEAMLAADPQGRMRGVGPAVKTCRVHSFASLQVGATELDDPALWVAPLRTFAGIDVLLGRDWLADKHVWLSFATNSLFIAKPE